MLIYSLSLNLKSLCLFSLLPFPVLRNLLHSIWDWLLQFWWKHVFLFWCQGNFTNVITFSSIYLDSNICILPYTLITLTVSFTELKISNLIVLMCWINSDWPSLLECYLAIQDGYLNFGLLLHWKKICIAICP